VGAADLYRGLAELDLERGDLEATAQSLETARKLGEQAALIDWPYRLNLAEARFQEAQGNLAGALGLLEEAERLHVRSPMPDVHPVAALKARIWIRQGRLAEAQEWVRQRGLSSNDTLNYLGEFEHITLARLLAAMAKSREPGGSYDEALGLLERLRQAAEAGGRLGSLIEILILQALTEESRGNPSQALAPLEQALDLAKAEGYQRVFIDEGPGMAKLLARIEETGAAPHLNGFIRALLDVFSRQDRGQPASPGGQSSAGMALVEPLSPRELDVLRLLRCELNGPEIAAQMMVSLNTFHTHTKNIYAKLGVNTRRAAVRRAEELELF
jgi:LuxR family maltose regulon positive regulatory protein